MNYTEFLESKIAVAPSSGIEISRRAINSICREDQKDVILWAVRGGRRAIFSAFGLGKTIEQLEILRLIKKHEGGKVLQICPLGVKQEFAHDAKLLGLTTEYVRNNTEAEASTADILITNYERVRDGNLHVFDFTAVSLDEASVLRGYGTKTYQEFLKLFPAVKYRFVATATPSPNRYKELIHYAGFLGIMDTGQALTRFFQRDSKKAGNLTLYPHKEQEFWHWMASWAVFITKPSDLGYSDEGFNLPEMKVHWHKINVDHTNAGTDKNGQINMFRDSALSLQDAAREKRLTLTDRINKMLEVIQAEPERHFILWHDLEAERHAIKKAVPECKEVFGSLDMDTREERIIGFSEGKFQYLATKPEISGSGCNFQYFCSGAVFLGINYKFNDFIQAIHRIYRFLQKNQVDIHIIYAESEEEIKSALLKKWKQHNELVSQMTVIIKKYGLSESAMSNSMKRSIGLSRTEVKGEFYTAVNNDCIPECASMPDNSIDLIHTSIPFSNHYEYTPLYNDFGHNSNNTRFFEQMDYLTPELLRILKPGRVCAVHVKDRIMFGNVTGYGMPSLDPFHMETTFHFIKHGLIFFGMITIETDVVRENNQTYRLGYTENCKDGSKMGVGCPEYLLLFRKLPTDTGKAYADIPVKKSKDDYNRGQWQIDARSKWNSSGNRFLTPEEMAEITSPSIKISELTAISEMDIETANNYYAELMKDRVYDYGQHVKIATVMDKAGHLPATFETFKVPARSEYVWHDVNRMRTLNSEQSRRNLQMHICPLQFDIVERVMNRFSNEGETVLDPFAGIMTVPYMAVKMGRIGYGIELNSDYFRDGLTYLNNAEIERTSPTLFDIANIG